MEKYDLLERNIKTAYKNNIKVSGTEVIVSGVEINDIIEKTRNIIQILNLDCTEENDIEKYNELVR